MTHARTEFLPESTESPGTSTPALEARIETAFRDFVRQPDFPCLGAKSVVRLSSYTLEVYGALGESGGARAVVADLERFSSELGDEGLSAFVAVFPQSPLGSETEFERRLWKQLQTIHEADPERARWADGVSADPEDPHFSFSVGGRAFFVVGLHPRSSRLARRFSWPALVFNPHEQFSRLREEGKFETLRAAIRARDAALQGTENPNLADFGDASEARQYSGRSTEAEWKCPFHRAPP